MADSQPPPKPTVDDVTLHAYDLMRNPFLSKNHLVRLDLKSYPLFLDGNFLKYELYTGMPNILSKELVGVRFERMLDEETAIFEVQGYDRPALISAEVDQGMSRLGELAVLVPAGTPELDPQELWTVEPLGTLEGTNGFGAQISVPLIRFDGYWRQQQAASAQPIVGDGKIAVELVKSRTTPTPYLTSLKPSFRESDWQVVNDEFVNEGQWEVCYKVRVLGTEAGPPDYVIPCWTVNVREKTVKIAQKYSGDVPAPDDGSTSRYFKTN
jgi:hypothetical protein